MKKLLHNISLVLGFVLLLGGLLSYAFSTNGYIDKLWSLQNKM